MDDPTDGQHHGHRSNMEDPHDSDREYEELDRVTTMAVRPSADQRPGSRRLVVVGLVVAAFVAVFALPRVFGQWVDPPEENVFVETTTTTTTIPPGTTMEVDTAFGPFTWTKIDVADPYSVVGYDERLWALEYVDQSTVGAEPEGRLVVSEDGVSWEQLPLPTVESGSFDLGVADGLLAITGYFDTGSPMRAWTSSDGRTWHEAPTPIPGPAGSPISGGFVTTGLHLDAYVEEGVQMGDTVLLRGLVSLWPSVLIPEFDEVYRFVEDRTRPDGTTFTVVSVENGAGERNETVLEQHGTSVEYTFWSGLVDEGTVVHTASLKTPDVVTAERIVRAGGISTPVPMTWRSTDGGTTFDVVADPFAAAIAEDTDSRHGVDRLAARNGRFVAYGRVPIGQEISVSPYAVRDTSAAIAAVATSDDGLEWQITRIPELVGPLEYVELGDTMIAAGQQGLWVFEGDSEGEFVPMSGAATQITGATDRYVVVSERSLLDISPDGRSWDQVPYPETGGSFRTALTAGDVTLYIYDRLDSVDGVWVGDLE